MDRSICLIFCDYEFRRGFGLVKVAWKCLLLLLAYEVMAIIFLFSFVWSRDLSFNPFLSTVDMSLLYFSIGAVLSEP